MLSKRAAIDMEALIASLMQMEDPITYLRAYLVQRRVPPQGRIFYSQIITGIAIHASIIAIVTICTYSRWRAGHLWLTRQQQGRTRLNATVIAMILAAVYSTTAMTYTALLLYVQHTGRYLRGSAAFEFSCFCSVSACISVICFAYYQSLPVGFESSLLRRMFGKSNAAADGRVFDFTLLWGWLVLSVTGITVAPIVHDYWRRQIDDSIAGMLVYLDEPSTRQQGVVALLQISDKASILAQQLDKAVESVRIVVLVYMAHAILFLCILVPVAFKLISLLNGQIHSLRQQAEEFFVLGSRMDIAKSQMDQTRSQIARNPTHSISRKPVPAIPLVHIDHTKSVTCHNCASEVPVAVSFADARAWRDKGASRDTLGPSEPVTHFRAFTPPPAPKRLQPRFQPPALPSHSEFPLIRAKRLQRVRLELVAFSVLLTAGLLAFIAGTAVMYVLFPRWDSATVTLGFYTICLWCWAIPALTACALYVYTTLALPRAASSCASTPTSRGSGPRGVPAEKMSSLKKITNKLASVGRLEKTDHEVELAARAERAEYLEPPRPLQLATRRTQPTYPRAPSISSVGMTTDAGRTERTDADTDAESLFVPPVPMLVRSGSRIKKWVDEGTERVNTDLLAPTTPKPTHAPPPSLYSIETVDTNYTSKRARKRSMGPVSQTQSWLDIDEDDR